MKRRISLVVLSTALVLLAASHGSLVFADGTTDQWKVDESRSTLTFHSDAPAEKIVGTTEDVKGEIQWNRQDPSAATGRIYFAVSTMRTGNRLRDRHLQGSDWLNARQNPNVVFELKGLQDVKRSSGGERIDVEATAVGEVTLNGVTKEETATVEIAILPDKKVARIQPKLEFALADYEVEGTRGTVGSEVGKTIEVEALIYADW